jgi:hypothetical protein
MKGFETGKYYLVNNNFGWAIWFCEESGKIDDWARLRFIRNYNQSTYSGTQLHKWDRTWSELTPEQKAQLL